MKQENLEKLERSKIISFDKNTFMQAIEDKDYLTLKTNTVSAMRQDPAFRNGEAEMVLEILRSEVPEIFQECVTLGYEETLDRDAWDRGYFTELTYWFQENFSLDRVDYMKKVGEVVCGADTPSAGCHSAAQAQIERKDRPTGNFPRARMVIAAVIILAFTGLLVLILK